MKPSFGLIQLLMVAVGMFAIGGLLNGERINRQYDRQRIRAIEAQQKIINVKVDSLYRTALAQEEAILKSIDSTYLLLDEIYEQKSYSYKRYAASKENITRQREKLKLTAQKIQQINRPFSFKQN
ncbi:MAG: hypothetical protein AAF849_11310 [Bacteroidota bacterium]